MSSKSPSLSARPLMRLAAIVATTACSLSPDIDHEQQPNDPTGWRLAGAGKDELRKQGDASVLHEGRPVMRLSAREDSTAGYGTWMNVLFASPYVGERIRVSAYARTAGATRRADFWARVQGRNSPADGQGLIGKRVPLPATGDWQRHEIVMDVPKGAVWVQYGVGLSGPGLLWMDRATIEVVDRSVPVTVALK